MRTVHFWHQMPTDDRNLAEQTSATPYTGHDSWKAVDVSISPISHRFENLKWLGAYFGKTEISQRLFSKTENFRALRAPHAKSEATFVAREFKAAVRMCPQICAAAPPWVRLKNAMQNEGGPFDGPATTADDSGKLFAHPKTTFCSQPFRKSCFAYSKTPFWRFRPARPLWNAPSTFEESSKARGG